MSNKLYENKLRDMSGAYLTLGYLNPHDNDTIRSLQQERHVLYENRENLKKADYIVVSPDANRLKYKFYNENGKELFMMAYPTGQNEDFFLHVINNFGIVLIRYKVDFVFDLERMDELTINNIWMSDTFKYSFDGDVDIDNHYTAGYPCAHMFDFYYKNTEILSLVVPSGYDDSEESYDEIIQKINQIRNTV